MRTATIYNFLLEANIMASMAILLMILLRKFLRKPLGNGPICFGWLMVALRLLCPLTLPNPLIGEIRPVMIRDGAIRPIAAQLKVRTGDAMGELYHFTRRTVGMAEESAVATGVRNAYLGMYNGNFSRFLMKIYLLVLMLLVVWMVIANVHFLVKMKKRRIEPLTGELKDVYRGICGRLHRRMLPVYYVDPLESPCLVGVFRPYIALPLTAKPEDVPLMLEHEMRHYKG